MIDKTARILKALGEPTRLKIVKLLSSRELCICELVAVLAMSQPRISQHVKVLKEAGVVSERRHRQNSYLSLNAQILDQLTLKPLKLLMETNPQDIPEIKEEYQRYLSLDSNEDVIACKTHVPKGMRIPQII